MPRPSFYNDNEHRAYPFIYADRGQTLPTLVEKTIVDAGFIMGLDADFNEREDSIWLESISRINAQVNLVFKTDAPAAANFVLTFSCATNTTDWLTLYSNTAAANIPCAVEPVWEGFIVISNAEELATIPDGGTVTFQKNEYRIEPARIQNLARSYLRSISVGNFERTQPDPCGEKNTAPKKILSNARCLTGDIRFKEGYQALISQNNNSNTITFSAGVLFGQTKDAAFCEFGSELPLFDGDAPEAGNKFYARGPACDELIFTVNGIGGPAINILGGPGISITTTENQNELKLTLQPNTKNSCSGDTDTPDV